MWKRILTELREHAPYTMLGTLSGVVIMLALIWINAPRALSEGLFWIAHPLHVILSAYVTAAMYHRHASASFWRIIAVGYFGSVGIATLSDSIIPFIGEKLLQMPHGHAHLGFIEKWWVVNPLALAGILLGSWRPHTKIPHAAHVWVSTWASLFHMTMAAAPGFDIVTIIGTAIFLFLAVWIPCCTSDIVFPLLFVANNNCPTCKHSP